MKSTIAERRVGEIGDFCVDEAIGKANTLIEAMGWIRRFRGKTTVIKLGGSLLDDESALMHILLDVIFMESVGSFLPNNTLVVSNERFIPRPPSLSISSVKKTLSS